MGDVCDGEAGNDEVGVVEGGDILEGLVEDVEPFLPVFCIRLKVPVVPTSMTLMMAFSRIRLSSCLMLASIKILTMASKIVSQLS